MNFRKLKVILIDLSGTIHIDDAVIPQSIEAIERLRKTSLKIKFVTNTTKESKGSLFNRLSKIGFKLDENEIFTSLNAARHLIDKRKLRPFYMLSNDALKDFENHDSENHDSVVVGLNPLSLDYENMTKALRILLAGNPLIAIHKARYYKRKDGLAIGPGAFVTGLEYSSGIKAEVVGKPEKSFFLTALKEFECSTDEAIMIGDDICDDVEGAMKAGLLGALVKTGKYLPGDENKIDPPPTIIGDNFSQIIDKILVELNS